MWQRKNEMKIGRYWAKIWTKISDLFFRITWYKSVFITIAVLPHLQTVWLACSSWRVQIAANWLRQCCGRCRRQTTECRRLAQHWTVHDVEQGFYSPASRLASSSSLASPAAAAAIAVTVGPAEVSAVIRVYRCSTWNRRTAAARRSMSRTDLRLRHYSLMFLKASAVY